MRYLLILAFVFVVGCATTGTFDGVVKNPDGAVAYTFEGESNSETRISPEFASSFNIFGMSLEAFIGLLIGGGVLTGGGIIGKKKLDARKKSKK